MSYAEADILSKKNKEFIRSLFPEGTIYASLLPKDAQDVIGKVGHQTRGVEKMLRRIGFRYAERVDPFDGGPHFTAATDEITLVQRTQRRRVTRVAGALEVAHRSIIAVEPPGPPYFRAVLGAFAADGAVEEDVAKHLGIGLGDEVWVLPLD